MLIINGAISKKVIHDAVKQLMDSGCDTQPKKVLVV